MKFDIHKKEQEGLLYENGAGKKVVGHSKLKLWTFFWDHGEREWPLLSIIFISAFKNDILGKKTFTVLENSFWKWWYM